MFVLQRSSCARKVLRFSALNIHGCFGQHNGTHFMCRFHDLPFHALCRSVSWQYNRGAARIGGSPLPAVSISDGGADDPLGLALATSDDHSLNPFTILQIGSLFRYRPSHSCSAHNPWHGCTSLSSPRGYGDSCTGFENKIADGFFEVAIAAASVRRFDTVVHPVKSLLWSFTLATRVCLRRTTTHTNWTATSTIWP